jgi:serine/threonine protein kinase
MPFLPPLPLQVIVSSEAPSYESSATDLWSVGCTIYVMLTQLTPEPAESVYAQDTLQDMEAYFNIPSFFRAPFLPALRAKMQRDVDHAKARVHSWVQDRGMDAGYAVTLLTMLDMQGPERLAVLDWDDEATAQHGAALVAKLNQPAAVTVYTVGENGEPIALLDKSVEPFVAPVAPLNGGVIYVLNEDGEPMEMSVPAPAAPEPVFLAVPPGFELMAGPPPGL